MTKVTPAFYEHGTIRLIKNIPLPEHQKVLVAITIPDDDIPSLLLSKLAESSKTFDFHNNPEEDIYSPSDGEEV